MTTESKDNGRRPDPEMDAWVREAQAQEVQDKVDTLIWLAKPDEPGKPRYTPPTAEEFETNRAVSGLEDDIPLTRRLMEQGFDSWKWLAIPGLIFLVLIFIAVLGFAMVGRGEQAPAAGGEVAAPTGRLWYFTNTKGLGLYTIALQGDGQQGTVDVIEDKTDSGTYTWQGDTLTIDFTRKLTMDDGYVITDPWTFECTGTADSTEMSCDVTVQHWSYSGRDGFEVMGEDSWPANAVPR